MRTMQGLVALTLTVLALAGCVEDNTPDETTVDEVLTASGMIPVAPDQSIFLGTVLNDHATEQTGHAGHQLPELHAHDYNFQLADHNDLGDGLVGYGSGYIEVHVAGDLAVVASIFGSRGATIVDVSDPNEMEVLSHIYNLDDNWDSRLSEDGRYLFLGCQGSGAFDCTSLELEGESSPNTQGGGVCTSIAGQAGTGCPGGVAVFDLLDPRNPVFVDYLPMGFTHNVFGFQHDNGNYYVMNPGVTIAEWNPEDRSFMIVYEGGAVEDGLRGVHDIDIQRHPITGDWLLYTGSGSLMSIWNLNDPAQPEFISTVEEGESGEGIPPMWHEQTPMPCLIDGRHITIGAGESGGGLAQAVGVVDTTDPSNPVYLGQWQLPDHASISSQMMYRFSLHNIDGNCDGQVALGHYHAGVWVFDISTFERMQEPVTMGYYMPHERSITAGFSPVNAAPVGAVVTGDQPNVWAAQWSDDGQTLFIPDMVSGLYALQPVWDYEQ